MAEGRFDSSPRRLLFVCTGNTCRSPLAEALAREGAEERGLDLSCRSAGVSSSGGAVSPGAASVAREAGLDLSDHRSTQLGEELVSWADLVVCMGESHRWQVLDRGGEGKACLVTEFLPEDDPRRGRPILDPVGGELDVYRKTLETLRTAVGGLLDRIEDASGEGEA